jgi:hypothetical protein
MGMKTLGKIRLWLELPHRGVIYWNVMPDNPSPAARPESSSEPVEFNFDKPASDNPPRIKRRSLKAKASVLKPAQKPPTAARELERQAPPLSTEIAAGPDAPFPEASPNSPVKTAPVARITPISPPRTTPTAPAASPASSAGVSNTPARRAATGTEPVSSSESTTARVAAKTVSSPTTPAAPHGTRPATLYYSSYPKKETASSMKPTTNSSPAASSPASTASASSITRPATVGSTAPTRPSAANIDYRANVERQNREQKSVGNILAYFVYGLIAVFVIGGGLAIYGSVIIFDKLHDQSATLSDLDARYALKVNALNTQITATQDTLAQAQAEIARQQDLINKQQEDLNRLLTAMTENTTAIKMERQSRAQETAALRARLRDLEYRTTTQKF